LCDNIRTRLFKLKGSFLTKCLFNEAWGGGIWLQLGLACMSGPGGAAAGPQGLHALMEGPQGLHALMAIMMQ